MITWFVMIHYCIIAKESSYPNTLWHSTSLTDELLTAGQPS
jgi:hypothetical protein